MNFIQTKNAVRIFRAASHATASVRGHASAAENPIRRKTPSSSAPLSAVNWLGRRHLETAVRAGLSLGRWIILGFSIVPLFARIKAKRVGQVLTKGLNVLIFIGRQPENALCVRHRFGPRRTGALVSRRTARIAAIWRTGGHQYPRRWRRNGLTTRASLSKGRSA